MNNHNEKRILSYRDLLIEKSRLEESIHKQKSIIRHNVDELRLEFKQEIRPALDASKAIKKFFQASSAPRSLYFKFVWAGLRIATSFLLKRSNGFVRSMASAVISKLLSHISSKNFKSRLRP